MKKLPLSDEEQRRLGIMGMRAGVEELLQLPVDEIARGRGAISATIATLFASQFAGAHFLETGVPLLASYGIRVETLAGNPRLIKVQSPPDAVTDFRTLTPSPEGSRADPDDPSTKYIDLAKSGPAYVELCGDGLLLCLAGDKLVITEVLRAVVEIEPFADIDAAPIAEWCTDCQDAWLVDQMRERLAVDDAWTRGVAAGMYARLLEPRSAKDARACVQRLLDGEIDEELARPRRWARALTEQQRATIDDLALAEIDRLHVFLAELEESMTLDDASWQQELLALCHARDDLEGVRALLAEANADQRLAAALDDLDYEGRLFIDSLPRVIRLDDERLWRVRRGDPFAWWARVATVVRS